MGSLSVSASIVVEAPPEAVFAILTDPRQHPRIDGSGSVRGSVSGPDRLELGSEFGMDRKLVAPYRIKNRVVEYEPDRRIAWRHFGRHRWRYELTPTDAGGTRVTETFDWSTSLGPALIDRTSVPAMNARSIEETLPRLKELAESSRAR